MKHTSPRTQATLEGPDELCGRPVVLIPPRGFAVRDGISAMYFTHRSSREDTARWLLCATLMLSWPEGQRMRGVPQYAHDLLDYGAQCWEILRTAGASQVDIVRAGNIAMQQLLDSLPTDADHEAARGNSEAPAGGSSESGAKSPGSGGPPIPTG